MHYSQHQRPPRSYVLCVILRSLHCGHTSHRLTLHNPYLKLMWLGVQPEDEPDDTRGGNTTAVSLGNNVALPLLFASIDYRDNSWLECLQDTGTLLKKPVRACCCFSHPRLRTCRHRGTASLLHPTSGAG